MLRWRLRRIFAPAAITFCFAVCLTGCKTDDPPPPKLIQTTQACIASGDPEQRFDYVAEREGVDDVTSARAVLEILLTDCTAGVRNRALEWLKHLPSDPPPHQSLVSDPPQCPDKSVWDERFNYADAFRKSGDLAAAVTLLQGALGDCEASVRKRAWEVLQSLPSPPATADCPMGAMWKEHFAYGDLLIARKQYDAARQLLTPDLASCDATTRSVALDKLKQVIEGNGGDGTVPPPPPPPAAAAPPYCPGPEAWHERLTYADALKNQGDVADARVLLIGGLSDCNAGVRTEALAKLLLLEAKCQGDAAAKPPCTSVPASASPPAKKCMTEAIPATWQARFDYAHALGKQGDTTSERALLTPALSDADQNVRQCALQDLAATITATHWYSPAETALSGLKNLPQALIGALIAYPVVFILWALALVLNRRKVLVDPLNVSGDGFKGDAFVAIVSHVSLLMDEMEWVADPEKQFGVEAPQPTRPLVATADITRDAGAAMSAAQAVAGDAASKIMTVLLGVLRQPLYRCVGTISLGPHEAQIVILLRRRRLVQHWRALAFWWPWQEVVGHWQLTVSQDELTTHLRQVAFEVLLKVAEDRRGGN